MKYIVIEIQTDSNGTVGILTYSYDNYNEAQSKYHLILSSAAISELPMHAATIITSDGYQHEQKCYSHT